MLDIGRLLNEAKALVEHGAWLPWLRRHTALPARTAQQYMAAAAWADAKNATVAHLELHYLSPGLVNLENARCGSLPAVSAPSRLAMELLGRSRVGPKIRSASPAQRCCANYVRFRTPISLHPAGCGKRE
jgi:hypothetical protein